MYPGQWPCNIITEPLNPLLTERGTCGADGPSAFRGGMLNSLIEEEDRAVSGLQPRRPVTNFCPPAGGISLEAAGCELPVSF